MTQGYQLVQSVHTDLLGVSLVMFYLNMMYYPVIFPSLSLTWDIFLTLRATWGFHLNFVCLLRPSKSYGWWWSAFEFLVTRGPIPLYLVLGLDLGLGLGLVSF